MVDVSPTSGVPIIAPQGEAASDTLRRWLASGGQRHACTRGFARFISSTSGIMHRHTSANALNSMTNDSIVA